MGLNGGIFPSSFFWGFLWGVGGVHVICLVVFSNFTVRVLSPLYIFNFGLAALLSIFSFYIFSGRVIWGGGFNFFFQMRGGFILGCATHHLHTSNAATPPTPLTSSLITLREQWAEGVFFLGFSHSIFFYLTSAVYSRYLLTHPRTPFHSILFHHAFGGREGGTLLFLP